MTIPFVQFPSRWKLPLHYIEVDPSRAGRPQPSGACLVTGVRVGGVAAADTPIAVSTKDVLAAYFGAGSQVARSAEIFLNNFPAAKLFVAGVAEPAGGAAATGSIVVASAPTAAGTIYLYIAGQRVSVGILSTDTTSTSATKIAAAINAMTSLPVTASASSATVTLTARWKGLTGNDIKLADSLAGLDGGESLPAGLTLTYTAMSGGTGSPDYSNLIAALSDDDYKFSVCPDTDSTTLGVWETEYGFTQSGRWGPLRQLYGAVFSAKRDTYANLMTFGPTRNSPVMTLMAIEPLCQSPVWEVAAAYAAQAALSLINDPARPLQTLELAGIVPTPRGGRFSTIQRNNLAGVGLAVQAVNASGAVAIVREGSTYQKNVYGVADDSYDLITTLYTLSTLFERQRHAITSKYPRHKLADDGTRFGPGQAIITPRGIKSELVAQYAADEYLGLVENARAFAANLIVERDPSFPTRVNVLYPPDVINGLRIFAVLAQFRLQYTAQELAAA